MFTFTFRFVFSALLTKWSGSAKFLFPSFGSDWTSKIQQVIFCSFGISLSNCSKYLSFSNCDLEVTSWLDSAHSAQRQKKMSVSLSNHGLELTLNLSADCLYIWLILIFGKIQQVIFHSFGISVWPLRMSFFPLDSAVLFSQKNVYLRLPKNISVSL